MNGGGGSGGRGENDASADASTSTVSALKRVNGRRMKAVDGFGEEESTHVESEVKEKETEVMVEASVPPNLRSPPPQRPPPIFHHPDRQQKQREERYGAQVNGHRRKGAYVPPALRHSSSSAVSELNSAEAQKQAWTLLHKHINSLVNKLTLANIKFISQAMLRENVLRGRGLLCRSVMKAQAVSPSFTPVFAALMAVVNSKVPEAGDLLCQRLVSQFKSSFRANEKLLCHASAHFLCHLANQLVLQYTVLDEILNDLLDRPSSDGVELAVLIGREAGALLTSIDSPRTAKLFDKFRHVLHRSDAVDRRVQYQIEVLFQIRKEGWKDNVPIRAELDLIEESEQYTHDVRMDEEQQAEVELNEWQFDEAFEKGEVEWAERLREIFGSDDEEEGEGEGDEEEEEQGEDGEGENGGEETEMQVVDHAQTDKVALRRLIYLTIMKSVSFEEAVHNLSKIDLGAQENEIELTKMVIECCSQERTYSKFYGLIAERFCTIRRSWRLTYEEAFETYYETIHRYESNRLRNIATLFGHLLALDAVSWSLFLLVKMNEDETTSSSRTFIKHLFTEMRAELGDPTLVKMFAEPERQVYLRHLLPRDEARKTRFSINYFTAIGLGPLTDGMRTYLTQMPKALPAPAAGGDDSSSDSDSSSELSSSSDESSVLSSSSDEEKDMKEQQRYGARSDRPAPSHGPRRSASPRRRR